MGGKREYITIFAIGAKLLNSFKGAIAAAQSRIQALEKTTAAAGKSILKFGAMFSTVFAGLAAFGVGAIFKKIFEGANQAAQEADTRTRSLTAALLEQNYIRARGRDYAQQQVAELGKHNDALVHQGVVSRELLELGESQLAITRLGPAAIAETIGPLSDALVAFKGVNATAEDMQTLSKGFGVAVQKGMTKPLTQFGIVFTDREQKLFKQMTRKERYDELTRRIRLLGGESARALKTPLGQIHQLDNTIAEMQRHIGEATLQARGEMAQAWSGALEQLEPIFTKIGKAAAHAAAWAGREMSDMVKAFSTPQAKKVFGDFESAVKGIVSTMAPATDKGKSLGTMFGDWWTKQVQDFTRDLIAGEAGVVKFANEWSKFWTDFAAGWSTYVQPYLDAGYKKMSEWIQLVDNEHIHSVFAKIGDDIKQFMYDPIGAVIDRWNEWRALIGLGKNEFEAGGGGAGSGFRGRGGGTSWGDTAGAASAAGGGGAAAAAARSAFGAGAGPAAGAAAGAAGVAAGAAIPVTVASYGGPAEPGQVTGSYNNRLSPGDVAISPNLMASLGVPSPSNYVMLDGQRYHVADTSWYHKNQPTSNMVEIWGYGNQIKRSGQVAKAYQAGGIVNRLTHAMLGERGPEAVIPLSGGARARGLLGVAGRALGMSGAPTSVNFAPNITINGNAGEGELGMLDRKLRDLARDFVAQFSRAQNHERRLSYEGGYG